MTIPLPRPRRRTVPSPSRPSRPSRLVAAPAALLLLLALTACGGDDEGDDPEGDATSAAASSEPAATDSASTDARTDEPTDEPSDEPTDEPSEPGVGPSEGDLVPALLTSGDLPSGFREIEPDDDDSSDNPFEGTCFADVQQFDEALGSEPVVEVESEFEQDAGSSQTTVTSKVAIYEDPAAVATKLPEYLQTIAACDSVKTSTPDGFDFDLTVATDDALTVPGAEEQARVELTGTISGQGQTFPIALTLVAAIIDGSLSVSGTSVLGAPDTPVDVDSLATLQGSRVQQVLG